MCRRELSDSAAVTRSYFEFQLDLATFRPPDKCSFEVNDPLEARTGEIVLFVYML